MLTIGSLFSGIGGFELGLERTNGFKTIWQCEIDPFCQQVLTKHWPNVKRFSDITLMGIEEDIPYVDVICGGFPCQPVSIAGKRKGDCDERWMWPEFYRIICQVRPKWVIIENVPGLLSFDSGRLFRSVLWDLSKMGYDAEWKIIKSSQFKKYHRRARIFIVAYSNKIRFIENIFQQKNNRKDIPKKNTEHKPTIYIPTLRHTYPDISQIIRETNGISEQLDATSIKNRIGSIGNSIDPDISHYIGNCILNAISPMI